LPNISEYAKFAFRIYWLLFELTDYYFNLFLLKLPLNRAKRRIWEKGEASRAPNRISFVIWPDDWKEESAAWHEM